MLPIVKRRQLHFSAVLSCIGWWCLFATCYVQELLKLATLLYSANRVEDDDDGDDNHGVPEFGGEDNIEPSLTSQVRIAHGNSRNELLLGNILKEISHTS